jgi:hypothetical protein
MTTNHSLSFCARSASRPVDYNAPRQDDDRAKCINFGDPAVAGGAALGAFQNFAIVRPGQQIFFARDIEQQTDSLLEGLWQRIRGDTYSPGGAMLVIDLAAPETPQGPLVTNLRKLVRFSIDDRLDPMMPMSRKVDDFRFLSLQASKSHVQVRMIDFTKDEPSVADVRLTANGKDVDMHRSWALRPMLVLETKEAQPQTKLVFSRGELVPGTSQPIDGSAGAEAVTLETLVFQRDAAAAASTPFERAGGATCTVASEFTTHGEWPCLRAFDPKRPMRASPAAIMQTSQLLAGRFAGKDELGLAFVDSCKLPKPVILRPTGDTFKPTIGLLDPTDRLTRKVTCTPLDTPAAFGEPIKHRTQVGG